jgi:sec-independent protein translocase protein TatA
MNIGPREIVVLAVLLLLLFGGRRLPQAGHALGDGIRNLIDGVRGMHPADEDEESPRIEESAPPKDKAGSP